MNIRLQKATLEDWQTISECMKKAKSRIFHATIDEPEVKKFIESCEVFLILNDILPIGFISAYRPNDDSNYIDRLVVVPEFQGKGIATQAMKQLLEKIGLQKPVELHTHPENQPAIKVYWKLGFQIKGWVDNYYGDGQPRIILIRTIKKPD